MKRKFIFFTLFLILIIVFVKFFNLASYVNEDNLKNLVENSGFWAPLIFILLYSVTPVLFIPAIPFALAAGAIFGPLWGVIYANIGATIGASFAFLLARYFVREWAEDKIKGSKLEPLKAKIDNNGWKIVAFTRLIPIFPYNLLNYFFGITDVKFYQYFLATFLCMLPGCIAYVVFGSSIFDIFKGEITKEFIIGIVFIVVVSTIPIIYRRFKK